MAIASREPSIEPNCGALRRPRASNGQIIVRAHRDAAAAKVDATDDAALCERIGVPVTVVLGSERAFKITDESDFARAEALIMAIVDES